MQKAVPGIGAEVGPAPKAVLQVKVFRLTGQSGVEGFSSKGCKKRQRPLDPISPEALGLRGPKVGWFRLFRGLRLRGGFRGLEI